MLKVFSAYIPFDLFHLSGGARLSDALNILICYAIEILFLLVAIFFLRCRIRSYFPLDDTKYMLSHKNMFMAHSSAAQLGSGTSFCSFFAVGLFIGFIAADALRGPEKPLPGL